MFLSLPADLNDLLWLDCFVSSAALRIQELEQFLKCFGVRGVVKESAFPANTHEVFRPKFVEMVREGGIWNVQLLLNLSDYKAVWMCG
jgi:hypothetical protein